MEAHEIGGSTGVHAGRCSLCDCPGFCLEPSHVPDGAIGSEVWPGLCKLIEECGETLQVAGKLLAYPTGGHPDGTDIIERIGHETADLYAVIQFFVDVNPHFDDPAWDARYREKLRRFHD